MNNNIIEIVDLIKTYKSGDSELKVLKKINLNIKKGEILTIVGESGSGKSTLLNLIGGLDRPTSGSIKISGKEISNLDEEILTDMRNKMIGFVFQFHNLLLDFTALENVMMPYLAHSFNWNEAEELALELLEDVGLAGRINHRPGELSGGEQQRVAVARALINRPEIILADEPTGNLDFDNSESVRRLLWNLTEKYNLTLIVVTHNMDIAKKSHRMMNIDYGCLKNFE